MTTEYEMETRIELLKPLQPTHTKQQAADELGITLHNVDHVVKRHGLRFVHAKNRRGCKLEAGDIPIIRELAKDLMLLEIAEKFDVTPQTISNVMCGRTWNNLKA